MVSLMAASVTLVVCCWCCHTLLRLSWSRLSPVPGLPHLGRDSGLPPCPKEHNQTNPPATLVGHARVEDRDEVPAVVVVPVVVTRVAMATRAMATRMTMVTRKRNQ